MTEEQLKILLQRYKEDATTPEEDKILFQCFAKPEYEAILKDFIAQTWDSQKIEPLLRKEQFQELYQSIYREITTPKPMVIKLFPRKGWMVAASVALFVLASSGWFLFFNKNSEKEKAGSSAMAAGNNINVTDIAPPSSSNAVIFFDDGAKISLNNSDNELLEKLSGAELKKLDNGQIIYSKEERKKGLRKNGFNTLYNPRGSQMASVVLSDGTKVWLNAESSLKYPVNFAGPERRVEVSGEAYFEVAHQQDKPFLVKNGKTIIRVLGTHFNVNTFGDEEKVVVTLLEGSVNITNGNTSGLLKPGQQARVDSAIQIVNKSDTAKAIAWKHEAFNFTHSGIVEIMKQMERWYDVQVEYEGTIPSISLSGVIERNINASKVLEMLQMSSGLNFRIEGRKIIVRR